MKQLLDFFPLVIFVIFLFLYDIFAGVKALMVASTFSFIFIYLRYKKIEKVTLFTYLMVMIFGAMTLYFHNPDFIKWKVTIINIIFAFILLISQIVFKKNLIQALLGKEIKLNGQQPWNNLNMLWVVFFVVCAAANLYITYNMSNESWGIFKAFVLPGATLIFTIISGVYIYKQADKTVRSE